jgi:hypothetical protein
MNDAEKLKKELQTLGARGLALDIDETLADSNSHWFDHMFQFRPLEGIDKREVIERYKFIEHVPGWGGPDALDRMSKLMHSDEFNATIPLIEDSNSIVNEIHSSIPVVAYITARPQTVRIGTLEWLEKHNFPKASLLMRPSEVGVSKEDVLQRNMWKAQSLLSLYPEVIGIVDDNLGLAYQLDALKYPGTLYLYGPQTEVFEGNVNVIRCPTWKSVLSAVMSERPLSDSNGTQ